MATTTEDRSNPTSRDPGPNPVEGPFRLKDLYLERRDGPVTTKERRSSAIGGVVAVLLLAAAVGVLHLVDGSGELTRQDGVVFAVVAVVLLVLGYAFPRFSTRPYLANSINRGMREGGWTGKLAAVAIGLVLLVVAAVKLYY